MFNWKVFLAEFIGTFALVFIGAGAGVVQAGLLGVALAHGLTLMVFVYAYGHISGTHVNPAVTFGLAVQGAVKWMDALVYWVAQFLGAISAAGLLHLVVTELGGTINAGATTGALTENYPIYAMIIEAVLTFFLVNTVLHTAVASKGGQLAGVAIGMTLTAAILVGGPMTGGSLNPARTLGTAVYAAPSLANLNTYVIYLLGPFIGATVAALLFNIFMSETKPMEAETAPRKAPAKPVVKATTRKTAAKAKK
ncbi:MAG: aquaporin [Chloroflexi bacterium]|nr:aquaporin [Chloroflexota bacterium]MBI3168978.1 aquaporin [Chloroflexota bacterium]